MTFSDFLRPLSRFALAAGIAGAIGFAAPVVSFAQDAPAAEQRARGERGERGMHRGHHGRHGHPLRRMAQELELTDAQRAQIRAIMQEARQNRGERAPGARGEVRQRIQAVLTPAQQARAQELRQEHARTRVDHQVTRMTRRLSLNETQQQQVRGILRNAAMQRRALFEQAGEDPASAREAMRGLRESTQASIRSVLTSEQASELDEARARRGERGHHGRRGQGLRGGKTEGGYAR